MRWVFPNTGVYGLNSLGIAVKQRLALWMSGNMSWVLLNLVFLISLVDVILFRWYCLVVRGESFSISIWYRVFIN